MTYCFALVIGVPECLTILPSHISALRQQFHVRHYLILHGGVIETQKVTKWNCHEPEYKTAMIRR